ncbi:MAG TPA: YkyA family protein [Bacillota bacterium]
MNVKNILFTLMMLLVIFVFTACGRSTEEKIYNHLEEAVLLEGEFKEQQKPISKLEKKEQEIYEEIISLDTDEFADIENLSEQAMQIIDERREKLELEKESIENSQKEFLKIEDLIGQIEDQTSKSIANELFETMSSRYEEYTTLNDLYKQTLELEEDLYKMLKDEEAEQEDVEKKIKEINEGIEDIIEANENFNTYTSKYNTLKKKLYSKFGYEIAETDDSNKEEQNEDQSDESDKQSKRDGSRNKDHQDKDSKGKKSSDKESERDKKEN